MNLTFLLPVAIPLMAYGLFRWRFNAILAAERAKSRTPFGEKLLRPPGEGLRLKLETIRDDMTDAAVVIALTLLFMIFALLTGIRTLAVSDWIVSGASVAIALVVVGFQWRRIVRLRNDLRNYQLGFDGERYIGEKLSQLVAKGFRVFHDFVVDMKPGGEATNYNIDHVVVGAGGVFAIETKARRKPNGNDRPDDSWVVTYTGSGLSFAGGYESEEPIRQARRAAEDLSKWLTGSATRPIPVVPVVVIPGWYVTRLRPPGGVHVLSGLELVPNLPALLSGPPLGEAELRTIADRIEAHCRDVEV
ncbi:MAG: NERD domain-containing protein [Verrucomicrobia bacterium]|nr:NERD domain-containing protein [Verrucomicrobiota bacterium]